MIEATISREEKQSGVESGMSNETTHGQVNTPEPHGEPGPAVIRHAIAYRKIFFILVALTVVTVGASFIHVKSELFNVLVALGIATVKAYFVARFFMHLKFEGKLIYSILFVPLTLAVVLALALIPDIGMGRHIAMNDVVGMFEGLVGGSGR